MNRRETRLLAPCLVAIVLLLGAFSCGKKSDPTPVTPPVTPPPPVNKDTVDAKDSTSFFNPVTVTKTNTKKVFVHVMPWFETPASKGAWGSHWTMANRNPNTIDAGTGERQIASHYYPLTGPYASSDPFILEYQVLLMKLSGIDGALIDWYGTRTANDYPANFKNANALAAKLRSAGLTYAFVYEDAVMASISDATAKITAAKQDMRYLRDHSFSSPNYFHISGKPLLLDFGPQVFQISTDWNSIFGVFPKIRPKFLTLWYESGEAGANASGEYSWVYQDATPYDQHLDNFYNKSMSGIKFGSAFPGFNDYYTEGGWTDNVAFSIPSTDSTIFRQTVTKALNKVDYVQLVTWNDYGEGTMIEPTVEYGYSMLTTLQDVLGVPYTINDLTLVRRLYDLRLAYQSSPDDMAKLDQAYGYFVNLQIADAKAVLDQFPD